MVQNVTLSSPRRTLEFGIYRDGDNNLDAIQENVVAQAARTSATDRSVQFTVEDTTARHSDRLHTDEFTVADGRIGPVATEKTHDMSDAGNLASFVARTLDNAEASSAKHTWIELVDHGGGDGGGLQTSDGSCMSMPDIAKAISAGVELHAKEHPEDAGRGIDGVVANQCLMSTMGFADALSRAGVRYLAASPETMVAPGVPSSVAHDIAEHAGDPRAMAHAVVGDVMHAQFGTIFGPVRPAAAFDVLDLDSKKIASAESAIKRFNDDASSAAREGGIREALRDDVRSVEGMVRFPEAGKDMPWHADRPALAVYGSVASDARLAPALRNDALAARDAVGDLVLAHRESRDFSVFDDADYGDAAGPTIHVPASRAQIDPWASKGITETHNAFYGAVDQGRLVRAIA